MSEYNDSNPHPTSGTPKWVGLSVVALAVISLLGLGVGWSAMNHANSVDQSTQASVKQSNDALSQRLAKAEDTNQQLQSDLKVVTDKLNVTQTDLVAARRANRKIAADADKKLSGLQDSVNTQLATKANTDDVDKLNGDVTAVKGDLDSTKNNLQMATSSMGTLIARNHDEIDQLRRLGERDYYEFTVSRKAPPQKVGSLVQVQLKDINQKKNQFTMAVLADDKNFEKKNRSIDEPIFFYVGGSHSALELVVNKVTKTSATGYLSVPKSMGSNSSASAANTSGK